MIKYRLTTFLPLLLSYLLLGAIPSQGANVDDKNFEYYWEESPTKLTYTGKGNFNDAIKALNREFILMDGYIHQFCSKSRYNNDILGIIFNNIRPFPPHFDLTKARDLSALNDIDPMIGKEFTALSLSSFNYNITFLKKLSNIKELRIKWMMPLIEKKKNIWGKIMAFFIDLLERKNIKKYLNNLILSGKLTALFIDLSERENIEKNINALILWKELGKTNLRRMIKLPSSLNNKDYDRISTDLETKGWIIISRKKDLELVYFVQYCGSTGIEEIKERINQLIKEGADVNAKGQHQHSPLLWAVSIEYKDIVTFLIGKGADVNAKGKNGNSPLFEAIHKKNVAIATILIKNGADVKAKDKNGNSPLFLAIYNNDVKMVALLIENGADVNAKNKEGHSLLDLFSSEYLLPLFPSLPKTERTKMVTFLKNNDAQNSFFTKWHFSKVIFYLLFMGVVAFFSFKPRRERRALKKRNRRGRIIKKTNSNFLIEILLLPSLHIKILISKIKSYSLPRE